MKALVDHLAGCERVVREGAEVIPAWRIGTVEGDFLIFTRFDHDEPEQADRLFQLMRGFMRWKQAQSFLLGIEVWVGPKQTRQGEEAIVAISVWRNGAAAIMRRIHRAHGAVDFSDVERLNVDQIDPLFLGMLPGRTEAIAPGEAEELERVFGPGGELPAQRLS